MTLSSMHICLKREYYRRKEKKKLDLMSYFSLRQGMKVLFSGMDKVQERLLFFHAISGAENPIIKAPTSILFSRVCEDLAGEVKAGREKE